MSELCAFLFFVQCVLMFHLLREVSFIKKTLKQFEPSETEDVVISVKEPIK